MKKLLFGLLAFAIQLAAHAQTPKKIGSFTDQNYPVYLVGYVVQSSPDGNFLMFRGGNFQNHELVKSDAGVPNFSNWLQNPTEGAGLYLPDPGKLPAIPDWEVCYCYDVPSNTTGWGLCKSGLDYSAYKNDANLRLFKNLKSAEKEKRTIPDTDPIVIKNPVPDWRKGIVGEFYPNEPDYKADYFTLLTQRSEGAHSFDFYGNPGVTYPPEVPDGNKAVIPYNMLMVDFPTHSTTAYWFAVMDWKLPAFLEMELRDEAGNLIWHLYDTKGGFHPLETNDHTLRGNNHPWQATRFLLKGIYYLTVRNISTDKRVLIQAEAHVDGQYVAGPSQLGIGAVQTFRLDFSKGKRAKINGNFYKTYP